MFPIQFLTTKTMILTNQAEDLKSTELLEMFHVEELDDRLEMCWINCNECFISSNTTNEGCCGNQDNGDIGVTVDGACRPETGNEP